METMLLHWQQLWKQCYSTDITFYSCVSFMEELFTLSIICYYVQFNIATGSSRVGDVSQTNEQPDTDSDRHVHELVSVSWAE